MSIWSLAATAALCLLPTLCRRVQTAVAVIAVGVFLIGSTAASAAVFPHPETEARLLAQAAQAGVAKVIVEFKLPGRGFVPDGELPGPAAIAAQRAGIVAARTHLKATLAGHPALEYRSWDSFPLVAMVMLRRLQWRRRHRVVSSFASCCRCDSLPTRRFECWCLVALRNGRRDLAP